MTRLVLLILSFTFVAGSKGQTSTIGQSDIDLINLAIKDKRNSIFLISEMSDYKLGEIRKYVDEGVFIKGMVDDNGREISDTIELTNIDKDSIYGMLNHLTKFKWTIPDAKRINLRNIEIIGLDSGRSSRLEFAIKYQIVPPIYFKNQTYCILSFGYSCGRLCGHGQITIYQKTVNGWKRWKDIVSWDE